MEEIKYKQYQRTILWESKALRDIADGILVNQYE